MSFISSIFDPIGFLAPVLLKAKLILQNLCASGMGWDDPIPLKEENEIKDWIGSLKALEIVKIPRYIGSPDVNLDTATYSLHFFGDACEYAMGTLSYIRIVDEAGNIHTALIDAKSRVAPLKERNGKPIHLTIPHLELTAARIAAQCYNFIKDELDLKISSVHFWCDSTCALCQLRSRIVRHKPFVHNRVSDIRTLMPVEQWRYCPTHLNPADLASCGFDASDQGAWQFMLTGGFIRLPESEWPPDITFEKTFESEPKVIAATSVDSSANHLFSLLANRTSCFYKLIKHICWWKRFILFLKFKRSITQRVQLEFSPPRFQECCQLTRLSQLNLPFTSSYRI